MRTGVQPAGGLPRTLQPLIASLARNITLGVLAGFLAGMVTGGLGARIAMRVSALAAGDTMRGVLTEADAPVGVITAEGTAFLIIFGGFIGVVGGLIYAGVRPWIAGTGRWRGLVFGAFLLAIGGWAIVEGDNKDFPLLGLPPLNVAMFAALFLLFGVAVAPLFDWMARRLPVPSFRRRFGFLILPTSYSMPSLGSLTAYGFSLFIAVEIGAGVVHGFGEEGTTREFLRAVSIYALLVPSISSLLIARRVGSFHQLADLRHHPAALAAAYIVLVPPVLTGLALITLAIIQIFSASV